MKKHILLVTTCLVSLITLAQPDIAWQKSFGGSEDDQAKSIKQTAGGGYIVIGSSQSNDFIVKLTQKIEAIRKSLPCD